MASQPPKSVIIVGGSLSALLSAITLIRNLPDPTSITILEQSPTSTLQSHMAGVLLGSEVLAFLSRYDLLPSSPPIGIATHGLQSIADDGSATMLLKGTRIMTSWESIYFRLRANFDGLVSPYCAEAPKEQDRCPRGGKAVYETGKRVTGLVEEGSKILVQYVDQDGTSREKSADLVIGADGPQSIVRKICGGEGTPERKYAGYLAWRGVVPEKLLSDKAKELFGTNTTLRYVGGVQHCILYYIPGENGTTKEGERLLNFCWYSNIPEGKELTQTMTDKDGTLHKTSIAPGKVDPQVWERQREYARTVFKEPFMEVIDAIPSPFLHKITDFYQPQVTFMGGKVLLLGDASTLLRPHVAFSTQQAAWECKLLERVIKGDLTPEVWGQYVVSFTWVHWLRSVWFGEFAQRRSTSVGSAFRYWGAGAVERIKHLFGLVPEVVR